MAETAPFDVEIRLEGICAFVPDEAWDKKPNVVRVLLPDGGGRRGPVPKFEPGKDVHPGNKDELTRHVAFLRFPLGAMQLGDQTAIMSEDEVVVYLLGERLRFDFDEAPASAGKNKLTIDYGDIKTNTTLRHLSDVVEYVDPGLTPRVDSGCVAWPVQRPELLRGMVEITSGKLQVAKPADQRWEFPVAGSKVVIKRRLANRVDLLLKGLTRFEIHSTPFRGRGGSALKLAPPQGSLLVVRIANLCDQNPLQWLRLRPAEPDGDFLWHYQLMHPETIKKFLKGKYKATFPSPVTDPGESADGINCFGTKYPPP